MVKNVKRGVVRRMNLKKMKKKRRPVTLKEVKQLFEGLYKKTKNLRKIQVLLFLHKDIKMDKEGDMEFFMARSKTDRLYEGRSFKIKGKEFGKLLSRQIGTVVQ